MVLFLETLYQKRKHDRKIKIYFFLKIILLYRESKSLLHFQIRHKKNKILKFMLCFVIEPVLVTFSKNTKYKTKFS